MILYKVEHTYANGDIVRLELNKDGDDKIKIAVKQEITGSFSSFEIPIEERTLLDMLISSKVANGYVARETKSQDFD